MRGTPALRAIASASDERLVRALGALHVLRGRVRPHALRAAIRIANSFLDWALDAPDVRARARVVREMKRALVAYLAPESERAEGARETGSTPR